MTRINAVWFVGSTKTDNAKLCYSKRDANETLRRNKDWVWCNAIELQIPHQQMSLVCEDWRAAQN